MSSRKRQESRPRKGAVTTRPERVGGSVVVFEEENDNMHSNWTDQISISRTKRGWFSVYGRKFVESSKWPFRRHSETWDKAKDIKSPFELIKGLEGVSEMLCVELDWEKTIEEIGSLDWVTAAVIAAKLEKRLPPLPAVDTILRQRSLRPLGKVHIGVEWGYDMHDMEISFEQWIRILNGEEYTVSTPYFYEGERFTADWRFDINEQDQLYVGYDDGAVGWTGDLTAIHVIEGRRVDGADVAMVALDAMPIINP